MVYIIHYYAIEDFNRPIIRLELIGLWYELGVNEEWNVAISQLSSVINGRCRARNRHLSVTLHATANIQTWRRAKRKARGREAGGRDEEIEDMRRWKMGDEEMKRDGRGRSQSAGEGGGGWRRQSKRFQGVYHSQNCDVGGLRKEDWRRRNIADWLRIKDASLQPMTKWMCGRTEKTRSQTEWNEGMKYAGRLRNPLCFQSTTYDR